MLVDLSFNTGIIVFMLLATVLTFVMACGLPLFYGGLASKQNLPGIMLHTFVSICVGIILWFICGYSLCFSGDCLGGFIGDFNRIFMLGVGMQFAYYGNHEMPQSVFILYQMLLSVIAPVLISVAFINRITIKAYIVFVILWQLLVNYPCTHLFWYGGLFQKCGALDFAGGIVIHAIAGFAALAGAFFFGAKRNDETGPNSVKIMCFGAILLWVGWFGTNSGRVLGVTTVNGLVFLNTFFASAFAAIVWFAIHWSLFKKPDLTALLKGAVAGLVAISGAAGYVAMQYAIVIGVAAGFICFLAVFMKRKSGWDTAIDIWGIHGIGGIVGIVLCGIFSERAMNEDGIDGLLLGGKSFFVKECVTVISASVYSLIATYIILAIVNKITSAKVDDAMVTTENAGGADSSTQS